MPGMIQQVAPWCWPWPDRASVQALGRLLAGIVPDPFPGVQISDDFAHSHAAADVLVLASRTKTHGIVVTEALALVACRSSRQRSAGCRRPWARRAPGPPDL
jgi:hypothetical protein